RTSVRIGGHCFTDPTDVGESWSDQYLAQLAQRRSSSGVLTTIRTPPPSAGRRAAALTHRVWMIGNRYQLRSRSRAPSSHRLAVSAPKWTTPSIRSNDRQVDAAL